MRFVKLTVACFATVFLIACGGAPSDADIRTLVSDQLKKESSGMAMLGLDISEVIEVSSVNVLNKAEDGKNAWLIDVEPKLKFKKGISEVKGMDKQMALSVMFGDFKAGQEKDGNKSRLRVMKGDKGWMLADK